jgi:hypothetical protein
MPKKLDIPQENELTPEETPPPQETLTKPKRTLANASAGKRQISDAQREHLNNIRIKAMQKKAEMKEETLKAKLAKTIEKKELVKKYDEHTHSRAQASEHTQEKEEVKKDVVKPKKEKKIVYKLAESSSSSSSDDEDEKVVYVKKIKDKSKKQIHHKQENNDREYRQNESLDSTLYKSSQEILHKRAIEERVRANLIRWNNAMMPQEY